MIERLEKILENFTGQKTEITEATDLMKDLGLNSLELIEMVVKVEDEFDISIEDREIKGIASVGDVIQLIQGKINQ